MGQWRRAQVRFMGDTGRKAERAVTSADNQDRTSSLRDYNAYWLTVWFTIYAVCSLLNCPLEQWVVELLPLIAAVLVLVTVLARSPGLMFLRPRRVDVIRPQPRLGPSPPGAPDRLR